MECLECIVVTRVPSHARVLYKQKKYERKLLQALPKEEDLVHSLPCSLEELYNGRVRKMKITRHVVCTMCGG